MPASGEHKTVQACILLHQLMTAQIRVHDLNLECGDVSPLSPGAICRAGQSADTSAHSQNDSGVMPLHSEL